ncbi:MAG: hypothetical protein WD023_09510 [Ilumatobacteraceae bacterium]
MEVKAIRGPRSAAAVLPAAKEPPPWDKEQWVDEGPIRIAAAGATKRGRAEPEPIVVEKAPRTRTPGELDPEVVAEVEREAGGPKAGKYRERLTSAAEALERGRYDDARRMVQAVLRDLPNVAMAHEIAGLSWYCTGQWRKAAVELELARQLDHSLRHHPVLADCYRALKRYNTVDELWKELKAASPEPSLMAEGRIVAAGALADQGDLRGALTLMVKAREVPKKVRDYHLRQWYVIADLLDRSGEVVEARRYFSLVAQADAEFADVMQRLATLGR